jgi:hypothetical protein
MVIIGGKACQILNEKAIAKSQVEVACSGGASNLARLGLGHT